jgi:hypothetical protein
MIRELRAALAGELPDTLTRRIPYYSDTWPSVENVHTDKNTDIFYQLRAAHGLSPRQQAGCLVELSNTAADAAGAVNRCCSAKPGNCRARCLEG